MKDKRSMCKPRNARSAFLEFLRWPSVLHTILREKGRDLTQSYNKSPTPTEKSKKRRDNTKTPPKLRLHDDCGPT